MTSRTIVILAALLQVLVVRRATGQDVFYQTTRETSTVSVSHPSNTKQPESSTSSHNQSDGSLGGTTDDQTASRTSVQQESSITSPDHMTSAEPLVNCEMKSKSAMNVCQKMQNISHNVCNLMKLLCEKINGTSISFRILILVAVGALGLGLTLLVVRHTRCKPIESHVDKGDTKEHVLNFDDFQVRYKTETLQHWKLNPDEKDSSLHLLTVH
ncbi:uncharacterized protein LOC102804510 [Saccoglossus kowalevskii]|uniref:Uncharacterized protein LOC102804510 n=1 Tax=Saccoglossus kowalevskii TaxID=10224 RepID=A0ABM0N159_SACKO|nr:PREDICTED: uncharacterized protein LOC102804510 [Saccoglossus kowalevskii]